MLGHSGQLGFCSDAFLVNGFRLTFRQLIPFNSDNFRPKSEVKEFAGHERKLPDSNDIDKNCAETDLYLNRSGYQNDRSE